ncbi:hypothetical protein UA08_09159 [Talaromyces atroroseus]|uniref:Uncharacterized protein n=1 Tax=Talaromyces atroroseus TaxID=1441469 RepID=A0A1Q5Q6T0_TALAT|nr:hypothetical protein UA08_09159 [Talaromyces atroroseus]OKL55554.1 hypothetical protein UA08_09159 [Talaromyces atroroseus]
MKLDSIILGIISTAIGVVQGASLVYDANLDRMLKFLLKSIAIYVRVSHKGRSLIFFCNFESQDINIKCGNLIQPAKQVFDACTIGNSYNYGYVARSIVDGPQNVSYLVVIGDDYAFAP